MKRVLFGAIVTAVVALTLDTALAERPPVRAAAVCADYPNQKAAQQAHDTIDADGDGIYCESLPCPCLKPSSGTQPPPSSGDGSDLFKGRCKRGRLPDYGCTPGAVFKHVTVKQICTSGYTKRVRNVSESLKRRVYLSYGIRRHAPYSYEIDHLVSLELGGNNSQRNLWPEKQPGARDKDKVENYLHGQLCGGEISLRSAQSKIRHWTRVRLRAVSEQADTTGGMARRRFCLAVSALGHSYPVRILKGKTTCAAARRTLRRYIIDGTPPPRWTCFRGHGQDIWAATCTRRPKHRARILVRAYNPTS